MPKSMREELAVLIGLEILTEGIFFDTHDLRKLPFSDAQVTRVLASLQKSKVLTKVNSRKYLFTEEFLALLRQELGRKAKGRHSPVPGHGCLRRGRDGRLERGSCRAVRQEAKEALARPLPKVKKSCSRVEHHFKSKRAQGLNMILATKSPLSETI